MRLVPLITIEIDQLVVAARWRWSGAEFDLLVIHDLVVIQTEVDEHFPSLVFVVFVSYYATHTDSLHR